ncbi:unnamed protein product [Amoebophrya sp. A25]|nr:unnamed protein product [Amoebophrya sp. A25]|eukprot:GSA25T00001237001.1
MEEDREDVPYQSTSFVPRNVEPPYPLFTPRSVEPLSQRGRTSPSPTDTSSLVARRINLLAEGDAAEGSSSSRVEAAAEERRSTRSSSSSGYIPKKLLHTATKLAETVSRKKRLKEDVVVFVEPELKGGSTGEITLGLKTMKRVKGGSAACQGFLRWISQSHFTTDGDGLPLPTNTTGSGGDGLEGGMSGVVVEDLGETDTEKTLKNEVFGVFLNWLKKEVGGQNMSGVRENRPRVAGLFTLESREKFQKLVNSDDVTKKIFILNEAHSEEGKPVVVVHLKDELLKEKENKLMLYNTRTVPTPTGAGASFFTPVWVQLFIHLGDAKERRTPIPGGFLFEKYDKNCTDSDLFHAILEKKLHQKDSPLPAVYHDLIGMARYQRHPIVSNDEEKKKITRLQPGSYDEQTLHLLGLARHLQDEDQAATMILLMEVTLSPSNCALLRIKEGGAEKFFSSAVQTAAEGGAATSEGSDAASSEGSDAATTHSFYDVESLRKSDSFMRKVVKDIDGLALQFASEWLRNDRPAVINALWQNPEAFQYASEKLRKDSGFVSGDALARERPDALKHAHPDLLNGKSGSTFARQLMRQSYAAAIKHLQIDSLLDPGVLDILLQKRQPYRAQALDLLLQTFPEYFDFQNTFAAPAGRISLSEEVGPPTGSHLLSLSERVLAHVSGDGSTTPSWLSRRVLEDLPLGFQAIFGHRNLAIAVLVLRPSLLAQVPSSFREYLAQDDGGRGALAEVCEKNEDALNFFDADDHSLLLTREFVLSVVASDGRALKSVARSLRDDFEVVLTAVSQNGNAFQFAGESMRNNEEVAFAAAKEDLNALAYAGDSIDKDAIRNKLKAEGYLIIRCPGCEKRRGGSETRFLKKELSLGKQEGSDGSCNSDLAECGSCGLHLHGNAGWWCFCGLHICQACAPQLVVGEEGPASTACVEVGEQKNAFRNAAVLSCEREWKIQKPRDESVLPLVALPGGKYLPVEEPRGETNGAIMLPAPGEGLAVSEKVNLRWEESGKLIFLRLLEQIEATAYDIHKHGMDEEEDCDDEKFAGLWVEYFRGMAPSRIEPGEYVGNGEYHDTRYRMSWPEGYREHYLDPRTGNNVLPTAKFIQYVSSKAKDLNLPDREFGYPASVMPPSPFWTGGSNGWFEFFEGYWDEWEWGSSRPPGGAGGNESTYNGNESATGASSSSSPTFVTRAAEFVASLERSKDASKATSPEEEPRIEEASNAIKEVGEALQRIYNDQASSASADTKKKAFKQLCREWHPDKNPERKAIATIVFQFLAQQQESFLNMKKPEQRFEETS